MPADDFLMEEHLDAAVGNILQAVISRPELYERLRPPQTRIVKSKGTDYKAFTVRTGGKAVIRMGGATYRVLNALTSTAATYFVADERGKRPSAYWPAARNRLASAIDCYASPLRSASVRPIEISPRQATAATSFAQYAYRFVICHELAHVALDHTFGAGADPDNVDSLRASQDEELSADAFALRLQLGSLPHPDLIVTALSAPVYFIFLLRAFDDFRLALMGELVDHEQWSIEYSHPPYLHRIFNLMREATALVGDDAGEGLGAVQGALEELVQKVWSAALESRDKVAAKATELLADPKLTDAAELTELLTKSPIGVLQALDANPQWHLPAWPFHATVPTELTTFLELSPAGRARSIA
ncbi:hypothetical protein GCM10009630_10250 [Kribbella jejuensis]|uniref:Peptidase U49-like protein n=1 Tax=Kribbella jejuensis TaxID=236068 RepID=A0A542EAA8_9ACTN|nr:hypothetical protein [Kribbella jejuensis]TQJ12229.1 hypothetical protein FB475_5161 [Kribbella jejuensis]